ncbi:transmembrane protein 179B [Takifugu flavidus]|uniref:Transmembrane protein 179B n=1 Tax=Takifugu flavidus TaxID=433684 RepID=A0A5C6N690_9TELE|nr:transmembrane protein 179B [Takifugu flavidus]TWW63014.1 Transmembrane protein 179B [Takifugu flavidus]
MALTALLVLELSLYAGCFCCGIVTAASITILQGNFGGRCILYGHVNYSANLIGVQSATSPSLCYFISAISVIVAVVCFSLTLYWLYAFCIDGDMSRERIWMSVIVGLCGAFLFFLLITGCMLKIGRDSLCSSVTSTVPNITSCEEAQTKSWSSPLKGERFYNRLLKAETAVWVNFFFWLIIGALAVFHRYRSSASKAGGFAGPAGALFGETHGTAEETEPFVNRHARPQ